MHEDFIELQYNSIVKHVKGDYEYIVFNNASSSTQFINNENMCNKLNIKCININTNNFSGASNIAGGALDEVFKYFKNELIFKIDSDMFFISDINLESLMSNNDIVYLPSFSHNDIEWMWSGLFGLNTKIIDNPIYCRPVSGKGDTFIESHILLDNEVNSRKKINLFGLQTCVGDNMITSCNNDCGIYFNKNGEITFIEKHNFELKYNLSGVNLYEIYQNIEKCMIKYEFPEEYLIDIIRIDDIDTIIHFKSASWGGYSGDYMKKKKQALKKLLNK
tara:strand:+ start:10670 stop:11497 length:828 start_codon:yes stop_codon:yes gene_type:complete